VITTSRSHPEAARIDRRQIGELVESQIGFQPPLARGFRFCRANGPSLSVRTWQHDGNSIGREALEHANLVATRIVDDRVAALDLEVRQGLGGDQQKDGKSG
jgi:hypothetical protein